MQIKQEGEFQFQEQQVLGVEVWVVGQLDIGEEFWGFSQLDFGVVDIFMDVIFGVYFNFFIIILFIFWQVDFFFYYFFLVCLDGILKFNIVVFIEVDVKIVIKIEVQEEEVVVIFVYFIDLEVYGILFGLG